MSTTLHRITAGSYVTDRLERAGSWAVYRYENPMTGAPDGWAVARFHEIEGTTEYTDLQFVDWVPTLADARFLIRLYA